MHNNDKTPAGQRRLRFEEEEIWTVLPAPAKEQCLTLWRQVLASILKTGEERQNERKD